MQAPIGPASTPDLVVEVSEAGGLGTLAASWTPPTELRRQLAEIRGRLGRPFCVNLVLAFDQRERLEIALAEGAPVVSFSWGVDGELIRAARAAGASVLVQVGDLATALSAVDAGADGLLLQGTEAGGHVEGTAPTLAFVRQVRRETRVPLVAAGGIGRPEEVADALAAGAEAVACGTAFLAAREANVHPLYLRRLLEASAADTTLTTAFEDGWPDAPHRVIRNDTLERWEQAGCPAPGARPDEGETVATRDGRPITRYRDAQPTRSTSGEIESMALYAGTSVSGVRKEEPAAAIVRRLASGGA